VEAVVTSGTDCEVQIYLCGRVNYFFHYLAILLNLRHSVHGEKMQRFSNCRALVLKVKSSGESDREAALLTEDAGVVYARLYGGPKSRLRSHVSVFNSGIVYLYHDPVRNSYKISDFDVREWRPAIRESYEATMAAYELSETLLKSYGSGGDWRAVLDLAETVLDCIAGAIPADAVLDTAVSYFLWHYLGFLGLDIPMDNCACCDKALPQTGVFVFDVTEGGFLCSGCAAAVTEETHSTVKIAADVYAFLSILNSGALTEIATQKLNSVDKKTAQTAVAFCRKIIHR
jgi:DNA repair protein RecO (recombination protein O)